MPAMAILGVLTALALVVPGGADETVLVSRADGASGSKAEVEDPLGGSLDGVISTDGRYVAFTSDAPNLVDGDDNETDDVFVRDLRTQRNVLSAGPTGGAASSATAVRAKSPSPATGARSPSPRKPPT